MRKIIVVILALLLLIPTYAEIINMNSDPDSINILVTNNKTSAYLNKNQTWTATQHFTSIIIDNLTINSSNLNETDPIYSAWDKDYNDLINKPNITANLTGYINITNMADYENNTKVYCGNITGTVSNLCTITAPTEYVRKSGDNMTGDLQMLVGQKYKWSDGSYIIVREDGNMRVGFN